MNSNSTHVCRLCLESSDNDLLNISEKFQDSTIASVLTKHFWFQIDKNDGLPEWVCEICWIQTKTFHNFYKRLEFRHKNYWTSINLASVVEIKQEPERSISPTEAALEADLNLVKCDGETLEAYDVQTVKEKGSCDDNDDDNSLGHNESEDSSEAEDANQKQAFHIEQHSQSEVEKQDAQIRKFFRMKCDICSDIELDTLKKARKHYRQVHKTTGYLVCCGMKFRFRHRMLDHIRFHVNPDAHRCEQCGRSFRDRQALKNHEKSHIPEDLRDHKCNLCSKVFRSAAAVKFHVQNKHPTETSEDFPCNQCGKVCPTKYSLASHIKNVHDLSLDHVCEICGRAFKRNTSLRNHKDIVHSTTPPAKIQCDICGTWLKHKRGLRNHLALHQEMQAAQDGKADDVNCPICKKNVRSKRLLANHIAYTHGERKYRCTFCDKTFKRPKMLKEHIALHTGVDLYNCPYCDRTFKSNANMYSHRKKAHLAEWTRDRVNTKTTTESIKLDRVDSKNVKASLANHSIND